MAQGDSAMSKNIPYGWKKKLISDFSNVVRGGSPRPAGSPLYFNGDYLPWITVKEVTKDNSKFLTRTESFLTKAGSERTRIIEAGTFILTNSGATLGVPKITKIKAGANDGIAMILEPQGATNDFLYFYFSSLTKFLRESAAPGNGQPNLNTEIIGNLPILLPPLPEQKSIADLLSTWDEAIEKTERLIQAKEKRFKWLLRELISEPRNTQKDAKWKKVKISDIGEIKKGKGITKSDLVDEGYSCIRYAEIYTAYRYHTYSVKSHVTKEAFNSALELQTGDVLFAASGETQEEIGKCIAYLGREITCTGGDTIVVRPNIDVYDPVFLGFALNHPEVNKQKSANAHGNSVVHLYGKDLGKIELFVPDKIQQKAIAEALTASQQEIDLLKQLAEKYKTQKRGLMQKMLTGEWRVKPEIVNQYMEA
jgi:type I restriction enzyme S subunit